jgi:predicted DNA-binding protein
MTTEKLDIYLKVRVGQEMKDQLRRLATAEGRSVGNLVRRVLEGKLAERQKEAGR